MVDQVRSIAYLADNLSSLKISQQKNYDDKPYRLEIETTYFVNNFKGIYYEFKCMNLYHIIPAGVCHVRFSWLSRCGPSWPHRGTLPCQPCPRSPDGPCSKASGTTSTDDAGWNEGWDCQESCQGYLQINDDLQTRNSIRHCPQVAHPFFRELQQG